MKVTVLEYIQMEYDSIAIKRLNLLKEIEKLEKQMDRLANRVGQMTEETLRKEIEL